MEYIPATHAARVGMRYPGCVDYAGSELLTVELDLVRLAPGRSPTLYAELRFNETVAREQARKLTIGDAVSVVAFAVSRYPNFESVHVSLPAHPAWLTWNDETVRRLARHIHVSGDTSVLPVLADALEDAGCADASLLEHCRSPHDAGEQSWAVTLLATQQ